MNESRVSSVPSLLEYIAAEERPKYLFFWGHTPPRDGAVGKHCLSQWWPASFEVDGVIYPTAEHFMMAEKARLFGDEESRLRIIAAPHPNIAKVIGRTVAGFDEERWNDARFDIVVRGSSAKFGQNPELRSFLLNTSERVLVEASPVDRVWGIGLAEDNVRATDPEQWLGLNLLGFALMEARHHLRLDGDAT
jgi:ribA/ribD-fused uncharacterized protein